MTEAECVPSDSTCGSMSAGRALPLLFRALVCDVRPGACVCARRVFNSKCSRVASPCSALHPHSPSLHSTRPLELPEAHRRCSSLCPLSCGSERA